jgi:ribosomal protein L28
MPNLRKKKYMIPELKQTIALLLSSRAIRTIDKLGGITPAIMNASEKALSDRLKKVRSQIYKTRVKNSAAGQKSTAPAATAPAMEAAPAKAAAPKKKAAPKKAAAKPKAKAKKTK